MLTKPDDIQCKAWTKTILLLFLSLLISTISDSSLSAAQTKRKSGHQKTRVLTFPNDRSLGVLEVSKRDGVIQKIYAKGEVVVPCVRVTLKVAYQDRYDLSPVKRLPADALHGISFRKLAIDDAQLANLSHLTGLVELDLSHTDVSDAGLRYVGKLAGLKSLDLDGTLVTAEGLKEIRSLTKLEQLNLQCTHCGDKGFESLASLRSLRELRLSKSNIGDRGSQALSSTKGLKRLDLSFTKLSNNGLRALVNLPHLEDLQIAHTKVNRGGLAYLKQMKSLNRIVYSSDQLSASDLKELRSSLPQCQLKEFATQNDLPLEIFAPLR